MVFPERTIAGNCVFLRTNNKERKRDTAGSAVRLHSMTEKSIVFKKKADILLFLIPGMAALCFLILSGMRNGQTAVHPQLEILTGNKVFGVYDLAEDQTIRIGDTNVCEIRDGEVRMTEADCPDQICVHSVPITGEGGSIVCLPNHIVLRVTDADHAKREVDSIAE